VLGGREPHGERRPASDLRLDADLAGVALEDAPDGREPDPRPGDDGAGHAVERLEDVRARGGRDAGSESSTAISHQPPGSRRAEILTARSGLPSRYLSAFPMTFAPTMCRSPGGQRAATSAAST
jgi:hypothetical protein